MNNILKINKLNTKLLKKSIISQTKKPSPIQTNRNITSQIFSQSLFYEHKRLSKYTIASSTPTSKQYPKPKTQPQKTKCIHFRTSIVCSFLCGVYSDRTAFPLCADSIYALFVRALQHFFSVFFRKIFYIMVI